MRVWIGSRVECRAQRRGVHEPGAVFGAALQQIQRRAGVLADGAGGVLACACGIGDAGEVQDGVAAGHQVADGRVACPNCATYLTLIGWHIRAPSGGVLLVVGALVGLLAGVLLVLAERLIGKH